MHLCSLLDVFAVCRCGTAVIAKPMLVLIHKTRNLNDAEMLWTSYYCTKYEQEGPMTLQGTCSLGIM